MKSKNFLLFIAGLSIGVISGVIGSKKYFQNKYQKKYEEDHEALEEYYRRTDEYNRIPHDKDEEDLENCEDPSEKNPKPGGRMNSEERKEFKKKLNCNCEEKTNYAAMYDSVNCHDASMYDLETALAEAEHPMEQGEPGETGPEDLRICANCAFYDDSEICELSEQKVDAAEICDEFKDRRLASPEEMAFDDHRKNMNNPPKIISEEAYSELPAYIDKKVLYLYSYDEMVVDEDNEDEPIDEPERLIGDALTKYGFIDNEERIIFVMNYSQDTCYEIQKINASWTDSH